MQSTGSTNFALYPKTTNFSSCRNEYIGHYSKYANYTWTGRVIGIVPNPRTQITYEGCKALCGGGNDRYPWSETSSTLSTWLLPIVGMLLQAPFVSNHFWGTVLVLARWIGSPMSSLACILWNISVSGKCAMMVDLAVEYDQPSTEDDATLNKHLVDFRSIRDSLYILSTMNQYSIKKTNTSKTEAEGLLRMILFSKDLQLKGTHMTLREKRHELARTLRRRRRRNAVPVFISTMWFLFSLAISIDAAFDKLGDNTTAHELAMGLLLAWLPILVLSSIVDCGSVAALEMREQINSLVDLVCVSLQDPSIYEAFIHSFPSWPDLKNAQQRVTKIRRQCNKLQGEFFTEFAGQGRVRWHYGVAHPILSDIENCHIAEHGRNWLANEEEARMKLVLGSMGRGLFWFDYRELWQMFSAIAIVGGCCFSGFVVSFFTPTIGLGCRSLGFLIYVVNSLSLVIMEFVIWRLTSYSAEDREEERLRQEAIGRTCRRRGTFDSQFSKTSSWATYQCTRFEDTLIRVIPTALTLFCKRRQKQLKQDRLRQTLAGWCTSWHGLSFREQFHYLFFVPLEVLNSVWLIVILLLQTFGFYVNCRCKSSMFGLNGGYVDLVQMTRALNPTTKAGWIAGTVLSCTLMAVTAGYIVCEWCLQSHISSEDDGCARRGLARVRVFRRWTFWLRYPLSRSVIFVNDLRAFLLRSQGERQKTLLWTVRSPTFSHLLKPQAPSLSDCGEKGCSEHYAYEKTDIPIIRIHEAHDQIDDGRFSSRGRPLSGASTVEVFWTPRTSFSPC